MALFAQRNQVFFTVVARVAPELFMIKVLPRSVYNVLSNLISRPERKIRIASPTSPVASRF